MTPLRSAAVTPTAATTATVATPFAAAEAPIVFAAPPPRTVARPPPVAAPEPPIRPCSMPAAATAGSGESAARSLLAALDFLAEGTAVGSRTAGGRGRPGDG